MAQGYYAKVASSAFVAGTISQITGGKFANGAWSGAFRFMFNEWYHDIVQNASRIIGGIGGALQVASGGILIYTGVGAPLGTLMVMQGANNL